MEIYMLASTSFEEKMSSYLVKLSSVHSNPKFMIRIWTKKMRNYHSAAFPEPKRKKPSTQKSNFENEKNGLKTEFSVAWYLPYPLPALPFRKC